jgi:hypothetical protein
LGEYPSNHHTHSIFWFFDHLQEKKPLMNIEIGDMITTRKWIGPQFLEYSHSGIVVKRPYWSTTRRAFMVDIVDCLNQGCGVSHAVLSGKGPNEVRVVRLRKDVADRSLIIHTVVLISKKIAELPNVQYCFVPRQFVRALLKRCFVKNPNFKESLRYYENLKEFLAGESDPPEQRMGFFCSRFALLVYQLAVLMLNNGNVSNLKPCFAFQPMYCRPDHVARIAESPITASCWEHADIKGFEKYWFRGDDRLDQ